MLTTTTFIKIRESHGILHTISSERVDRRDPLQFARNAKESITSFYYYDIIETLIEMNGTAISLKSSEVNVSKIYHIDGTVVPLKLSDWFTIKSALFDANMTYTHVCHPRCKATAVPFEPRCHETISSL